MITKLTSEQKSEMIATREKWLAIGRSCQPIDRPKLTKSICKMYEAIGEKRPMVFVFPSPLQCILAFSVLKNLPTEKLFAANLGDNLRDNLGDNLRDNLWDNLGDNLWDNLGDNLGDNLRDNLGDNLWDNLRANLRDNLWDNLWDNLRANLWDNLRDNLRDNFGANLWDNLRANLWDNLWDNLRDNFGANLWDNLRDNLWDNLGDNQISIPNYFGGNQWCGWEIFYDFCNHIGVPCTAQDRLKLNMWLDQSQECHWWFPFKGIVLASDRPEITELDERGRLHCTSGMAMRYRDGYGLWVMHGIQVPRYVIESPIEITVEKIESENNVEIRRSMIEQYVGGMAKYILDSKAEIVHRDSFGTLYRKREKNDEDIWMVHVICPSTKREYFLGVDPNAYGGLKTAQAAVASTWRDKEGQMLFKKPEYYEPLVET